MFKLLKWPKINILSVYFVPNYHHLSQYVNKQLKCSHYAKHKAPVSGNQNILKLKIYMVFRHYFMSCQKLTTNAKYLTSKYCARSSEGNVKIILQISLLLFINFIGIMQKPEVRNLCLSIPSLDSYCMVCN